MSDSDDLASDNNTSTISLGPSFTMTTLGNSTILSAGLETAIMQSVPTQNLSVVQGSNGVSVSGKGQVVCSILVQMLSLSHSCLNIESMLLKSVSMYYTNLSFIIIIMKRYFKVYCFEKESFLYCQYVMYVHLPFYFDSFNTTVHYVVSYLQGNKYL